MKKNKITLHQNSISKKLFGKLKSYYILTFIFFIVSFCLCLSLFFAIFIIPKNKKIDSTQTVLVSQKNADFIDTITLQASQKSTLVLKKVIVDNSVTWIGNTEENSNSITFPVDSFKITQFLKYMTAERSVQTFSTAYSNYSNYNLNTENSFRITLSGVDSNENIKTFLDLYCGITDFTGQRVYFRTNRSTAIYRTTYDFYNFCTSEISTWIDGLFLPSILLNNRTQEQVQSVILTNYDNKKNVISSTNTALISTVFSMQSAVVAPVTDLQNAVLQYTITVHFLDNTNIAFSVYKKEGVNTVSFFIQPDTFSIYSYILEISEWSVLRLKDFF